jgi:hypothetical protein
MGHMFDEGEVFAESFLVDNVTRRWYDIVIDFQIQFRVSIVLKCGVKALGL